MTQEEKAKAYDEAYKRVAIRFGSNIADELFPELTVSEDEKIRKALINYLKSLRGKHELFPNEWITWLEKQGEQKVSYTTIVETGDGGINAFVTRELPTDGCDVEHKPTDKVKPKFKIGEWITNGDYTWKIVDVKILDYILQSQNGNIVDDTISHVDKQFHSFTIEDAKDGDVLYSPCLSLLWIFKSIDTVYCGCNLNYNDGAFCGEGYIERPTDAIPATKKQRDTLMKAIANAGYTFDFEKKELKLLITNGGDFESENCVQNNEWGEEDEAHINSIIDYLLDYKLFVYEEDMNVANGVQKELDWLQSIKEKNTWKPSDEQISALSDINITGSISYPGQGQELINLYSDLKKLKG